MIAVGQISRISKHVSCHVSPSNIFPYFYIIVEEEIRVLEGNPSNSDS